MLIESFRCWTYLCDGLCQANDTGFSESIVGLAGISMDARGGRDVDDTARFTVLDTEVGSCGADELEGCGPVQGEDGVPLLVGDFVDDAVPGEAGVVDDLCPAHQYMSCFCRLCVLRSRCRLLTTWIFPPPNSAAFLTKLLM